MANAIKNFLKLNTGKTTCVAELCWAIFVFPPILLVIAQLRKQVICVAQIVANFFEQDPPILVMPKIRRLGLGEREHLLPIKCCYFF